MMATLLAKLKPATFAQPARDTPISETPARKWLTPFNLLAGLILLVGLPVMFIRFTKGIGAVSNLTDTNPWGFWIGIDILSGVALAAGGFTVGSAVYIFGLNKYRPVVRPAILTGFLGYVFAVLGLLFDLGRPWRLPYPLFYSYGFTSVMLLVGWHFAAYLTVLFIEFSPALFEWLGFKKFRAWAVRSTVAMTILGLILSTQHQSALGAMFLLAPGKLHPLWYSPFLPLFFFVSAIIAGMTMVIFESMISHRIFGYQISAEHHAQLKDITMGLGQGASAVLFTYFWLLWAGVGYGHKWALLSTPLGAWFLVEVLGFVLGPCLLLLVAVKKENVTWVRLGAIWAVLGVILNRVNISMVALNWNNPERYVPDWKEIMISVTIITLGLLTFRFIAKRMPIFFRHPAFVGEPEH